MSKRTAVVDAVCAQRRQMKVVIALLIAAGLLLALSALFVVPGDAAYPILVIDAALVGTALVGFLGAYRYCTKRAMNED